MSVGLGESALTGGCTSWRALPPAPSGIFATASFTFIFAWNDGIFALVLTRTEVRTLTVEVTGHCRAQSRLWAKVPAVRVLGTCRSSSPARPCSAPWSAASRSAGQRVDCDDKA